MKRLHIHVNTSEKSFGESVEFYSTLFNSSPSKERDQYAKWMLDDPRMNFVVEVLEIQGDAPGIHHIGIQVDESDELDQIKEALKASKAPLLEVGNTNCCYAESEKNWTLDPSGVKWETFRSIGDLEDYGSKTTEELELYNVKSSIAKSAL